MQKDDKIMKMVNEIHANVKGLKNYGGGGGGKVEYGCEACCFAGKGRSCTHCFHCGSGDHRYAACPVKKSLNSNRLSTRDQAITLITCPNLVYDVAKRWRTFTNVLVVKHRSTALKSVKWTIGLERTQSTVHGKP